MTRRRPDAARVAELLAEYQKARKNYLEVAHAYHDAWERARRMSLAHEEAARAEQAAWVAYRGAKTA